MAKLESAQREATNKNQVRKIPKFRDTVKKALFSWTKISALALAIRRKR